MINESDFFGRLIINCVANGTDVSVTNTTENQYNQSNRIKSDKLEQSFFESGIY